MKLIKSLKLHKKKIAVGVAAAAAVAVASVAVNMNFEPGEFLRNQSFVENHTRCIQLDDVGETSIEYTEPEELGKKDRLRRWLLSLPVPVKALLLLPLWALGSVPVALGAVLLPGLSAVWGHVLGFGLEAGVLGGVFCAAYKALFPEKKVRDLFKKKNRRWILLGAAILTVLNIVLTLAWPKWVTLRAALMAAAAFLVLCLLWRRLCGRLRGPEPGVVRTRLKLEY